MWKFTVLQKIIHAEKRYEKIALSQNWAKLEKKILHIISSWWATKKLVGWLACQHNVSFKKNPIFAHYVQFCLNQIVAKKCVGLRTSIFPG